MDIAAIEAQQERLAREGQTPPDGNYVGYADNLIKVINTAKGKQLVFQVRAASRINGRELVESKGYEPMTVWTKFEGIETNDRGTFDNEKTAVTNLLRLGLDSYGVAAVLDAAKSAQFDGKVSIILSNTTSIMTETGEPVSLKGKPVQLSVSSKDGRAFASLKTLPKDIANALSSGE
jgi:hypothetical protein